MEKVNAREQLFSHTGNTGKQGNRVIRCLETCEYTMEEPDYHLNEADNLADQCRNMTNASDKSGLINSSQSF